MYDEKRSKEVQARIFNVKDEEFREGAWWWWFWLFFWDNPENPERPRQLMVLWSTKRDKSTWCNGRKFMLDHSVADKSRRKELDGTVASWYYDGREMHHDFLLEQCRLKLDGRVSAPAASFTGGPDKYEVKIRDDMMFRPVLRDKNEFTMPDYHTNEYQGGRFNYKLLRMNRLELDGGVDGEEIKGSAYFQRVFVNAPAVPWYWGGFHFKGGGVLTYYLPHFLGKALKKDIAFWDGKELHKFKDIAVKRKDGPVFLVSGESEKGKISFEVHSYAHSAWRFRKGITRLTYNEYPAVLKNLVLDDKEYGEGIGNAEDTRGLLL